MQWKRNIRFREHIYLIFRQHHVVAKSAQPSVHIHISVQNLEPAHYVPSLRPQYRAVGLSELAHTLVIQRWPKTLFIQPSTNVFGHLWRVFQHTAPSRALCYVVISRRRRGKCGMRLSYKTSAHTGFSSEGRAKLRAFSCYCMAENMQLCPPFTRKPCRGKSQVLRTTQEG